MKKILRYRRYVSFFCRMLFVRGKNMQKKYPIVLQEDSKDCGAACLLMIMKYYHGNIPYEELKEQLKVSKSGIAANQIVEVAQNLGFESEGVKTDVSKIQEGLVILPCIAHVLLNESYYHYVVLFEINIKKGYFLVGDPAKGISKIPISKFEQIWTGILLTLIPKKTITYIESNHLLQNHFLELVKMEKKPFVSIVFLSIVITVASVFFSFMLEHFISMLENHNEYSYLYCSIALYMSFLLLKNGSNFFRNKIFFHIYQKIDYGLMEFIFHRILNLPYRYYKTRTTGDMIARIQDIGVIRSFLAMITLSSLMDLPLFLISGIFLYVISRNLFLLAILTLFLYAILCFVDQKRMRRKVEQLEENSARVTSYMVEALGGYESVFGSHLKHTVQSEFNAKYIQYLESTKRLETVQNQSQLFNQSLFDISILFLLAFGIWQVSQNQLTISSLLLFHSLFLYFIDPIRNLLQLGEEFRKVKTSWKRLSNLFYETKELGIYHKKLLGDIKFKKVTFAYQNDPVLDQLSFHIKAGSKVLIIGESGQGKSTILKLMMKYYPVSRNSIYFDQIDIMDYKTQTIEDSILYISMKEQLFTGTISENILLGKKPNSEYQTILTLTETDQIISKTPLGHQFILEENGANLSGGEKERVVLARTLLRPFQILLLDEATSQMDSDMERRILKKMFERYKNQTIIMVAHRVDNADLFDHQIEIEDGKIKKDVKKNGT